MTIDNKNTGNAAQKLLFTATDDELLEELDTLVAHAAEGDRQAVGAIAIAFGPMLLDEAREALGPVHAQDGGDIVQDLAVKLLEGALLFPRIRGAAIPWLNRMVRVLAQEHRWRSRPPPGDAAE